MHRLARYIVPALLAAAAGGELVGCGQARRHHATQPLAPPSLAGDNSFTATAYSGGGRTASGTVPTSGVVAADPAVLPLGSRIRVHDDGGYSGEYVVRDTGGAIRGRKIDVWLPRHAQAKRFGRRRVRVEVIQYGDGRRVRSVHRRHWTSHRSRHSLHRPAHRSHRAATALPAVD